MEDERITATKAFRFLSPLMIVVFCSLILVSGSFFELNKSGGWSMIGVIIFLPILIVAIIVDFFIKSLIKDDTLKVWIVEMIIVVIACVIYYNRFS